MESDDVVAAIDEEAHYTVIVIFSTHPDTDPHLRDAAAIEGEFESWLESLEATVHSVTVRPAADDERSIR